MKNAMNIKKILIFVAAIGMAGPIQAESLLEIYQQALQSDPRIHEAEARRLAALEAEPQARSLYLPQIDADASWTETDSSGTSIFEDATGLPVSIDTDTESELTQWQIGLRQTIFRWDQIVGIRRADKIVAKAEADREAAQQDLIIRVSQAYFNVLAAEDRLTSLHANRQAIARQLEQAKQRFEVGLIAITDVQESQAAYDQAVADEIGAKRVLATARNQMQEITGQYVNELSAPGDDLPLREPENAEIDWVDLSLSQNLALLASRLDEEIARDEISFRRTGHYPSIDLVASTGDFDRNADRVVGGISTIADSDGSSDSIGVQFNLPLFRGGGTRSRVKEAVYLHRASMQQLQRVTRETERQTRDAYLGVIAEKRRVEALDQSVTSSRTALEATQAGFEVGTRTIVDVLDSQFALYRAITLFYQARYDYLMNYLRLKQAAGDLQIQDLEAIDEFLVARPRPEDIFAEEEAAAAEEEENES
ncbi:MAG: TolC family outer membrane protein [Woeseiaceae bacterium]